MGSDARVTGQLRIVVLKARNLQNRRKLEKQNPYVTLRIGHIVESTPVDYRGGQTPHWDSDVKFDLTPELEPIMKLSILDETKKTPTLIAEKTIDISPSFTRSPNVGYDNWYTVEYGGRDAGEIFLEMTFYPTAPKVPAKIPIRNRASITKTSSNRPLPTIPGGHHQSQHDLSPYSRDNISLSTPHEDIMVKSFSSSMINRRLPTPPLPDIIPLEPVNNAPPSSQNRKSEADLLFEDLNDNRGRGRPKSSDLGALKKFATRFQQAGRSTASDSAIQPEIEQEEDTPMNALFKKRPFSTSPKKSFFRRFAGHQQNQSSTEDAFDLLEQEVASDWEKNHPNEFQEAIDRRFGKKSPEEDNDVTSSWTRSISSLNNKDKQLQLPTYGINGNAYDESDDDEVEETAPAPPPKSANSSRSGNSLFSTHRSTESNDYAYAADAHYDQFVRPSTKLRGRKPPPPASANSSLSSDADMVYSRFSDLNIDIPFSADSIGGKPQDKSVYLRSQKLPKLPNGKNEDEIIHAKYHAPKPDKQLALRWRLESGHIKEGDLEVEPGLGGYHGAGNWRNDGNENHNSDFKRSSPTRFKPSVPPKVPMGMTDEEYYITDRAGYLKDLKGLRE